MTERRQGPRVPAVLDAVWNGHSGGGSCRVTDLSWQGCFVQSTFGPAPGDETSITVSVGGAPVTFRGRVAYVEERMGFAIRFDEVTDAQAEAMTSVLGAR